MLNVNSDFAVANSFISKLFLLVCNFAVNSLHAGQARPTKIDGGKLCRHAVSVLK